MTRNQDRTHLPSEQLLFVGPDTKLAEVLDAADELCALYPDILTRIEADQDVHGLLKKCLRIADQSYGGGTPALGLEEDNARDPEKLTLQSGRPRMTARAVMIFLTLRGYWGSICSSDAVDRMTDSMTLRLYLGPEMSRFPGVSTIMENVNAVSVETLEYIYECELQLALADDLDDFEKLTIDSTAVRANSAWPTDPAIIYKLLCRAWRLSQRLEKFGLPNFKPWYTQRWFTDMEKQLFRINTSGGQRDSKKIRKEAYRVFLHAADKFTEYMSETYDQMESVVAGVTLCPSKSLKLNRLWDQICADLCGSYIVCGYARDRVFMGKSPDPAEKIYSVSDRAAAFIKKGGRDGVIGYRVQLGRSKNGLVTALHTPQGNHADSTQLIGMTEEHIQRTGVTPTLVSTDDGYASINGRDYLKNQLHIANVSISGSKGKHLTTPDDWDSFVHQEARRFRSAVESLISNLKGPYGFGLLRRRGLEAVHSELLEKVIAYNFARIIELRKRRELRRTG